MKFIQFGKQLTRYIGRLLYCIGAESLIYYIKSTNRKQINNFTYYINTRYYESLIF